MVQSAKTSKCYCHKCKQNTKQDFVLKETETDVREVFFESLKGESRWVIEERRWSITKCLGCEMLNLDIETQHVGNANKSNWLVPGKATREVPTWIFGLESKYIELMAEMYSAFNKGLPRLSMMGARTVLDILLVDTIGDIGSFEKKLTVFKSEGYINKSQHDLLAAVIDAGNASAHRGYKPTEEVLHSVIDIIENVLRSQPLSKNLQLLKSSTPPRLASASRRTIGTSKK